VKKLKTKVWLRLSGTAEQREKAAVKVGCTSSIEDGKEILVLVDYRGHWIPKMSLNARMRRRHNKSTCSGPWQWGGVVHKQSAVGPWLIPVSIAEEGRQQPWSELWRKVDLRVPQKLSLKERASIWGICYVIIECDLCHLFLLFTCPSLQLQRGQRQHSEGQRKSGRVR